MRSVVLMALANIKRKRMQSFLICITIMISAMLLSTSIGTMINMQSPINKMFKKLNASQDVLTVDSRRYDVNKLMSWLNRKEGVYAETAFKIYTSSDKFALNGKEISGMKTYSEMPVKDYKQDKLLILEGEKKKTPGPGEIWVPTGYAYSNNIKVGDNIILKQNRDVNLKVTAIVVDAQFSCTLINPPRIWVAEGELTKLFPSEDFHEYYIGVRYSDYSKAEKVWKDFKKDFKGPFSGEKMDYGTINYAYNIMGNILAVILLVFSIVIIAVVLLIISFTIMNSIVADYKTIGVLRCQGFSKIGINFIYIMQYLIISVISIPIGILISKYTIKVMMRNNLKAVGAADFDMDLLIPFAITGAVLVGVIMLVALLSGHKANKVRPIEAIVHGNPIRQYAKGTSLTVDNLKAIPMSFALSLKQIVMNRRQSMFIIISMTIAAFAFTLFGNTFYSTTRLTENLSYFGLDNSDVYVGYDKGLDDNILKVFKEDKNTRALVGTGYFGGAYVDEGETAENIKRPMIFFYDGNMNSIGCANIQGRNPINKKEASLAVNTAKAFNKNVGDYLRVIINGKSDNYLVTGIFQTVSNNGMGIRMQRSSLIDAGVKEPLQTAAICLKDNSKIDQYISNLKSKFNNGIVIKKEAEHGKESFGINSITSSLSEALGFMAIIFFIVTFVTIFNVIIIDISKERKTLGIYKTIGMTVNQLRWIITLRIAILTLASSVVGIIISVIATPRLINQLFVNLGMAKFPLLVSLVYTAFSAVLCLLICLISSWTSTTRISKISSRELICE